MLSQALRRAIDWEVHKTNPVSWIHDFGLIQDKQGRPGLLDLKQQEIIGSNHKRIIINCHRQWGKSQISSLLCFHRALFFEKSLCLLVAPSLRQSSENFRKIIDSMDVIEPRPELIEDTKLTLKFANGSRIISLPGSQKTIRGFSAPDLIVIDEAAQADDELFVALRPMLLSNPEGRMILCSTPWGKRGFFFKIWMDEENANNWLKIIARATDNPRIAPEALEEMKREAVFESKFRQEAMCEFQEAEGAVFSSDLFKSLANPAVRIMKI